jgi:hypothetical protein
LWCVTPDLPLLKPAGPDLFFDVFFFAWVDIIAFVGFSTVTGCASGDWFIKQAN